MSCRLPDGRGRHRTANVPGDFAADRGTTAAAATSASVRRCHAFKSNRQKECVQMPGKRAGSDPRPSVRITRGAGSGQHLASVLQEGRENANIDAGLGFIWRILVKIILLRGSRAVSAHALRWRIPTDGPGLATTHTAGAASFCLEMC